MIKPLLIVSLIFTLFGCGSSGNVKQNVAQTIERKKLTESEELKHACDLIAYDFSQKNPDAVKSRFGERTFIKNVKFMLEFSPETAVAINNLLPSMVNLLVAKTEKSISLYSAWYLLKFEEKNRGAKCVLNSSLEDNGVSILELTLSKQGEAVKITNIYDHVLDTLLSDSMREVIKDSLGTVGLTGKEALSSTELDNLQSFYTALNEKDVHKTWQSYNLLPDSFRQKKLYAKRLAMLSLETNEYYDEAMENLIELSADDVYGLMFFDYYFNKKQYAASRQVVDKLEARLGSTGLFDVIRASTYKAEGNSQRYYALMNASLDKDMGYESTYWVLLEHFMEEKKDGEAVLILDILYKAFNYNFTYEAFASSLYYKRLAKTEVFKQWAQTL